MVRVGIYIRKASKADSELVQAETEELKSYVCKCNNQVDKTYIDNGYSGMNTNRPALKSLLEDCRNGKLDEVVILRAEQLSRNAHQYQRLSQQLVGYNVSLKVVGA